MMTTKAQRLTAQIKGLQEELARVQKYCKHKRATKIARANTGNYDPMDDRYWYECECPTCLLTWYEDQ